MQRDALLGAQYELNRKLAIFALIFNEGLDTDVARQAGTLSPTPNPNITPDSLVASWETLTLVDDHEVGGFEVAHRDDGVVQAGDSGRGGHREGHGVFFCKGRNDNPGASSGACKTGAQGIAEVPCAQGFPVNLPPKQPKNRAKQRSRLVNWGIPVLKTAKLSEIDAAMNPKDLPQNAPVAALNDIAHKDLDYSKVPYRKPQPMGMIPDLVMPGVLQAVRDPAGGDRSRAVGVDETDAAEREARMLC